MGGDLAYRIRAIFRRGRMEAELAEELQYHFDRQVEAFVELGCAPDEARRRARLIFGGLEQLKEECRDARGVAFLDGLWQDLRYAARLLGKAPGFAAVAVLSIALGAGCSTVAAWLLSQSAYRRLPVSQPERLVSLRSGGSAYFSYAAYLDLRGRNAVFSGLAARANLPAYVTAGQRTEHVPVELVSANYFEVFGVVPAAGRLFRQADEGRPGAPPAAVLSHEYWVRGFAKDPAVVGRSILLNNLPVNILGVSAPGLQSLMPGQPADVLVPVESEEAIWPAYPLLRERAYSWMNLAGRLKPGVAREGAEARLAAESASPAAPRLELIPAGRDIEPRADWILVSFAAIAAFVLVAACTNLAGLCLARAAARQKEIAIRVALGAGRARIGRQHLAEFLLPAAAGGSLGVTAALGLAGAVPRMLLGEQRARMLSPAPDAGIVLLAVAAEAAVTILFGAAAALLAAQGRPLRAISGGNTAPGLGQARVRKALVMAQVAFSASLMFGAFSFLPTVLWENVERRGPGGSNAIVFFLDAGAMGYEAPRAARLFQRLERALAGMPGAGGAGFQIGDDARIEIEGRTPRAPEEDHALWLQISPGFLGASGGVLVEGRGLDPAGEWPPRAVLVNEVFRQRLLEDRGGLGQHVRLRGTGRWAEVVGVVRDRVLPGYSSPVPAVYCPFSAASVAGFYVRTTRPPAVLLSAVKELAAIEAPGVPAFDLKTIDAMDAEGSHPQRVLAAVLCALGLLTMALAVVGVYGVTAYVVTRRTPEIAVRIALGATQAGVVGMVMKDAARIIALGGAAGLFLPPLVCGLLFPSGGGPDFRQEYPALMAGTILVAAVAALAGFRAARRAAAIEPAAALRAV